MVKIEDVTAEESSQKKNVRRRNQDLDDLNLDNVGSAPRKRPAAAPAAQQQQDEQQPIQSSSAATAEGEENSNENESTEVVPAPEVGPGDNLTFNEQVDRAREQMQPSAMEKIMAIAKSLILRGLVIYFIMYFVRSNSKPNTTTNSTSSSGVPPNSLASSNIYPNATEFDLYVYISDIEDPIKDFSNNLIWKQERLIYGDWESTMEKTVTVPLSKRVQNNGSFYIHSYIVPFGFSPDPLDKKHLKFRTVYSSRTLNKFKKKRYANTHNLLTGETAATIEEQEKAKIMTSEIVSHWHPNITIALVTDWTQWTLGSVPQPLNEYVKFIPSEQKYFPVLFYNDYWNLMKDYQPINNSLSNIEMTLTYQPISLFKWQIYAAQSMRNQWQPALLAGDNDEEQDTLKEAILDTNPYLLGLTFIVSLLHSIFEFLAFKNDIQFWNNRKSLEGLSVRSVFFNVFQSLIVLLYVLDNETNFVIRVSVFVGLMIEIWKINKVMDVKLDRENRFLGIFPRLVLSDKGSYVQSSTRQYDLLAFRYLSWALFPLLVGYAIYSLLYNEHKGWYSFVLSMLYGFLLTFGFIMMTPQLFINYKLKSVAHLPWRMLSYKFLNTFIDDIFAFVIKMPTMYRIGCLRDDVIFFIYLYQRYIYRIDPSRVNEFGFSAEMLEEKQKEQGNQITAAADTNNANAITNANSENEPKSSDNKKDQ